MKRLLSVAAIGALAFSLAGCQSDKDIVVETATPENIVGTWQLKKGVDGDNKFSPVQGAPVTLEVTDKETFTGVSGCNNYMGSVVTEGGQVILSVGGSTMKMCAEDVMKVENSYLEALGKADKGNIEIRKGKKSLHLLSPSEDFDLTFVPSK